MTPPRTRAKKDVPPWAAALRVRRAALGKSQEQVALDSGILNQTTVSELEGGRYEVGNLAITRLAGLARGLNWSLAELEERLGLDFNLNSLETTSRAANAPARHTKPQLPHGLQEAVELYSRRYPDLLDPTWQNYLAGFRWREGEPEEPEAWLDLYRDLIRAGVVPGSN